MIRTLLLFENGEALFHDSFEEVHSDHVKWYWVDFSQPTEKEIQYLSDYFGFQHLLIEKGLHGVRRPKVNDYGNYRFYILHALSNSSTQPLVVYLFEGKNYIITFHRHPNRMIQEIWNQLKESPQRIEKGQDYLLYLLMNGLLAQYSPLFCRFGKELEQLESKHFFNLTQPMMNRIFQIRRELFTLRSSLEPLRDVIKAILHPEDDKWRTRYRVLFSDIHDDSIRLVELTEVYRQMGLDLIEGHVSFNSQRMNRVIIILTVITTIFMPLTFIAGIYGMNFEYMPELHWRYGYYLVLALMGLIAWAMVLWFKRRSWF